MSKLLKFKRWLTIDEAARRLSIIADEQVTESDIFRLALDHELTLSVYFAKDIYARVANFNIEYDGDDERIYLTGDYENKPILLMGEFDVGMLGAGRALIEQAYMESKGIGRCELFPAIGEGIIIHTAEKDAFFELLELELNVKVGRSSSFQETEKEDRIGFMAHGDNASALISEAHNALRVGIDKLGPVINDGLYRFHKKWNLPEFGIFVVRTDELIRFERLLISTDINERPLHNSERKSAGQIIATMAAMAGLDLSAPYAADETLRAAAATHGLVLPKSPETVKKFLEYAAGSTDKN